MGNGFHVRGRRGGLVCLVVFAHGSVGKKISWMGCGVLAPLRP
jgi:hypothetical protein